MSTWYVRPDTSHSAVRDGTSYATAWGGRAEIVYGAGGFKGGDTLYVCGTHDVAAIFRIYNCAGTAGARTYVRGDYAADPGTLRFANGNYFLQPEVAYCTVKGLSIVAGNSNCIFAVAAASNCIYEDNSFTANNKAAFALYSADGQNHTDVEIRRNKFYGTSLESSGVGAGIAWFLSTTGGLSTCTRISIEENTFTGFSAGRSVIHFRTEDDTSTSSRMKDIKCNDNVFDGCSGIIVEFRHGHDLKFVGEGIQCLRNIFSNCYDSVLAAGAGGAFSLQGFAHSTTAGFGYNRLAGNVIRNVQGAAGAFNVFYGSYIIEDNVVDGLSTTTIDGNGLLFDHGSDGCIARRNKFRNIAGKTSVFNSGYGVMFLDAVNCDVYGNTFENVQYGVHAAGATTFTAAQQFKCRNNTFTGVKIGGCYVATTADKAQAIVKNNVFVGESGAAQVICPTTGGWTGEGNNAFSGFDVANTNHTLNATDVTADPMLDPATYRPLPGSPLIGAGAYVGTLLDKSGKRFKRQPTIGAYEYFNPRQRRW